MRSMKKNVSKKKRILIFLLTVITMFSVMGCSSPGLSEEVIDCIELGAEYLGNGEYEKAIQAYEEAIDLNEYAWEAHTGLITAMVKAERPQEEIVERVSLSMVATKEKAESGLKSDEIEEIEELYETVLEVAEGNDVLELEILITTNDVLEDNPFEDDYVKKLEEMVDVYINLNDYDTAQEMIDRLEEAGKVDVADELQQKLDDQKAESEKYVEILTELAEWVKTGDDMILLSMMEDESFIELKSSLGDGENVAYLIDDMNSTCYGEVIALYNIGGTYYWYLGQMDNGVRSGYGIWHCSYYEGEYIYLYRYEGQWQNDKPNGEGRTYYGEDGYTVINASGTYLDGLYHGTFKGEFYDASANMYEYTFEAENGIFKEANVPDWLQPDEGYYAYAALIIQTADGTTEGHLWQTPIGVKQGVDGFVQ